MSMKKRGSFIMLLEHVHTMDELTDEEFGKFVRAYASYIETGVEPDFSDRSMRMMWKTVKAFDDMNCEKYESTSAARREAGKRGAMKRWAQESKSIANDNKNSKCHFANSKNALSVSDSESDSVAVVDTATTAADSRTDSDLAEIVQHFQQVIGDFPRSALDKLRRYQETFPTEVICRAFDEAAENGVRKWRYVDGILKGWQADGVRTLGDVEARREARKKPEEALKCERKLAT
jgi:DnaD/phage-associated family protein